MEPYRGYDGTDGPRVAIAHDYVTQRGGAERVVLSMSKAFPNAPIHTLLFDPSNTYPEFANRDVRVSDLNRLAPLRTNHRLALPLLASAARSMFIDADVVLISTSGWAHGVRTRGCKLAYCYTPARWLYLRDQYLGEHGNLVKRAALATMSPYLKSWDRGAALSCDKYLAISTHIKDRIADVYGIKADVVHAPVRAPERFGTEPPAQVLSWLGWAPDAPADADAPADEDTDGAFYLCVSRLLPYKNVDRIVRAFNGSSRRLVVVGKGPDWNRIRRMAHPNVLMVSDLPDAQLQWLYQRCRALMTASWEDYGLTPIEAGAWGRPTVALRWGGFLDTVDEGLSGVFFDEPEPAAITDALDRFEALRFEPDKIREHVRQFTEERFAQRLHTAVDEVVAA